MDSRGGPGKGDNAVMVPSQGSELTAAPLPARLAGDLVHLALLPGNLGAGPLARSCAWRPADRSRRA